MKKYVTIKVHYTELNLISLIRKLRSGELRVKAQDGRPMTAEICDKKKIVLNRESDIE